MKNGSLVTMAAVNEAGVAQFTLKPDTYQVVLAFSGNQMPYEDASAKLTREDTTLTIRLASELSSDVTELYVGNAYPLTAGGTYVKLQKDIVNYFLFTPEMAGVYSFTTSDPNAIISFWGGSTAFINDMTSSTDYDNNLFTQNVKEGNIGVTYIIGVTGADDCVVEIMRIGDPILSEVDVIPITYESKHKPQPFQIQLKENEKLEYVDLTAPTDAYTLVYSEKDGYYHLGSEDGKVVYVCLGTAAPHISMYALLGLTGVGGTNLTQSFRDENGKLLYREDYVPCMIEYAECIDPKLGIYPLTDDLIHMIQNAGDYKGWWDMDHPNFIFDEVVDENGEIALNPEIAWMFACCYIV